MSARLSSSLPVLADEAPEFAQLDRKKRRIADVAGCAFLSDPLGYQIHDILIALWRVNHRDVIAHYNRMLVGREWPE